MEDYISYLKDEGYLICNLTGKLNMPVRKWRMDLPVDEILPLKETWGLIIEENLIASITRDTIVYTLHKQVNKDNFIYNNDQNSISLCIGRDLSGHIASITGYFYKLNINCFTYKFWC